MSRKIFRSIISVALTVLVLSLFITSGFLYDYFNRNEVNRLKQELSLVSAGVEKSGVEYFDGFTPSACRFTLISPDGTVKYDSKAQTKNMENHLDREEIKEALKNGTGSSARYSATLTERTCYEAVRLENGDILRISTTQMTIATLLIGISPAIIAIVLFSIVIAIILSQKQAKSIVKPLENINLDQPDSNDTYEELAPILARLKLQRKQISKQMRALQRKSDEFSQITANMSEGLVLLDNRGTVLSINKSALQLFNADISIVGKNFLTLDRSAEVRTAVENAFSGSKHKFREQKNGREYNFIISPTVSDGKVIGVVILCIDITESAFLERNRQEFTANVSHELKTPLQSIIGSAELLESGLVKPEDSAKFIGNIKKEGTRLVALINDIIRLSQLDEQDSLPKENVDLSEVAKEVQEVLLPSAENADVTLSVTGEKCEICGVRRYLYEIVYNLCDNAIRYNKKGGSVTVDVSAENGKTVLTVSDTGIGIAVCDQPRIFERFYRVDKSHSKETGGTGLGLSIVKHAVAYHGARIDLKSRLDEGTTVTVTFKKD